MFRFKRWVVGFVLFAALGCGSMAAAQVTHLTGGHGDVWTFYLQERAKVFEQQTGISIEILTMSSSAAREQLLVMRAAGISPDVTDFWGSLAGDYISSGFFEDLRPYAERAG